jgi:hypothetical protein
VSEVTDTPAETAVNNNKKPGPVKAPDHAPNYWDLRDESGQLKIKGNDAMDAVRAMCGG